MELAPHLRRIGNDSLASYLIDTDEGITLVDAGLPGYWRLHLRELDEIGKTPAEIRGLILTHGDNDHVGFAERLRQEHGVPVYIHTADAERARAGRKPLAPMRPMKLMPAVGFVAFALRNGIYRDVHVWEVVEVADGQVLPLPGAPEVVGLPGHSPGCVAFRVPVLDAVFVGDAVMTRSRLTGFDGISLSPFTEDRNQARESLKRLADIPASWLLPGHGVPWRGTPDEARAALRAAL